MQFQQQFDARQVEPASFPPPPPLADYHVRIVESEGKPTTDNTGGYLQLDLEILDPGPYVGRKIPYRLNLFNKSQQTVEIAYKQLSAICHVTGQFQVTDSRQLHNIPFIATIGPQANNPQYPNVFMVKDLNGNQPGKAGAPAPTPAPAPAPAWQAPPATAAPAPTAAPAWAPPQPAAAPAPAPAWAPPGQPAAPAPGAQQPPWAPAGASPAAPPWAK